MTPRTHQDPEGDKRRALQLAARAATRAESTIAARNGAIRLAADNGASLREIATATELDHMVVKRIIDRLRATADH